jgi:hypothetical protein
VGTSTAVAIVVNVVLPPVVVMTLEN